MRAATPRPWSSGSPGPGRLSQPPTAESRGGGRHASTLRGVAAGGDRWWPCRVSRSPGQPPPRPRRHPGVSAPGKPRLWVRPRLLPAQHSTWHGVAPPECRAAGGAPASSPPRAGRVGAAAAQLRGDPPCELHVLGGAPLVAGESLRVPRAPDFRDASRVVCRPVFWGTGVL